MKAVRIHEFGDLDVLKWEDVDRPTPRPNQVLIKVDAAGVNYADLMRRRGGYPGPDLPSTLGLEAAGTIEELGDAVSGLTVGQRVMGMGPRAMPSMWPSMPTSSFPIRKRWTRSRPAVCPLCSSPPTTC